MLASPEERQRAALLLDWLARVEYRYEICLFAWPAVEGFSVSDTIAGPIGLLPCKMPGADGLAWVSPTGGRLEFRKVDLEDCCTVLGYTDAPLTVSHMCVDPLSVCLVLVDNTRRLLYLVHEWESRDAPLAIAEHQGHRIRSVLEAERVGALFSVCCCGDGFVYCLSLTEDAEGVVRIDVRDDVGASRVVHRARGEYQSLVATSHEGTTELLWIQTQLKRNPESELVLWTSAVGRRTVATVDFAVGWLDVDNSRRLAWLCGFSRGAAGMRLWRVDVATKTITGIFPLSAGLRGCRIFAQANGRFWLLESASRKLRVLIPVFDFTSCAISEN